MRHYRALVLTISAAIVLGACALGASPPDTIAPQAATASPGAAGSIDPTLLTGSAAGDGVVTITFATHDYQRVIYEPLVDAFERENRGIHVQLVNLDTVVKPYYGADNSQFVDDEAWIREILSTADTAALSATPEAIANGWVRDLTPLIDADASFDRADFYPAALDAVTRNAQIYELPQVIMFSMITYNKDLWAQRGLPAPEPDWSWNDLKAALEQLARKRGDTIEVYGMVGQDLGLSALIEELAAAGAAEIYQAYSAAFERTSATATMVGALDRSPIDYYWFLRAVDRALQGQDLERELADAQALTERFLGCVRGGTPASACATQVDPEYQGWQSAAPEQR